MSAALKPSSGDITDDQANSVLDAAQKPTAGTGIHVSAGGYLGQQLSSPSTRDSVWT